MMNIALSESAVAVFRLRAKGLRLPATESRLPAYQELVEAGIMAPEGEGFRFTAEAWSQRDELLTVGQHRIPSDRFEPRGLRAMSSGLVQAVAANRRGRTGRNHGCEPTRIPRTGDSPDHRVLPYVRQGR